MPKYNASALVRTLRDRTGKEHHAVSDKSYLDIRSLERIENEDQSPSPSTLEAIMYAIEIPTEEFLYTQLDELTTDEIINRDILTQTLANGDIPAAQTMLNDLEKKTRSDTIVSHQFILSKKAEIMLKQGKPYEQVNSLIEEALSETYWNINENDISEATGCFPSR